MRGPRFAMILGSCLLLPVTSARADVASPAPSPSAPLDIGSRTSGLGLKPDAPVAQPQPAVHMDVTRPGVASGSGPDTPGKTGLGNTDRGPSGGAATGPGTEPKTGGPVGLGTPAPPPVGTR